MGAKNSRDIHALNDENLHIAVADILKLTGLPDELIQAKNVQVAEFKGEPVYISTNICGDETKPKVVLVHGFASSGSLYFKTIGRLAQHFCIILPDTVGMGSSSRPDDYDKKFTPQESIDYFVEYFEKWRQQMGTHFLRSGAEQEFTDFYLLAHSFGGYIMGNYALKYHQHIRKLILLSPVGIREKPPGEPAIDPFKRFEGRAGVRPPGFARALGNYVWNKKVSPLSSSRILPRRLSMKVIEKVVVKNRIKCDDKSMAQVV